MTLSTSAALRAGYKIAPGPHTQSLIEILFGKKQIDMLQSQMDNWKQYGDISRLTVGPLVIHNIVRPDHIQHVLVKNTDNYVKGRSHDKLRRSLGYGILTTEGLPWQRQRRLMQPTYTPKSIANFASLMTEAARQMLARWDARAEAAAPLAVNHEMLRIAMSVISRSMFGIDISEQFVEAGDALRYILQYTSETSLSLIDLPLFVPTPANRRLKQTLKIVDAFLYKIIDERRQAGPGDDLLSLLMTARDEQTGETMSRTQLRDEVLITFFAGHETTAQLLTWAWHLLAQHPEVEVRLWEELHTVLGGRSPRLDDVPKLIYTRMMIDETLRLYSPVAVLARDVVKDDVMDGYHIPAGSMMTLVPYVTHRHPEFWEKPQGFFPEHFTPERVKQRPRYAYLPFGAGPRICIGNHFALLEATLILAEVAQHYQLRPAMPGQTVEPDWAGTLRPKGDVMMVAQPRR